MATIHPPMNTIGNNSVEVVIIPSRAEATDLDTSLGKPVLTPLEEKDYEIASEIISAGNSFDLLKWRHCQAYLKKHGMRVADKKGILINRIREYLELKDGGGEVKYPLSTFSVDCQGDVCIGDVVLFKQRIFEEKFDNCLRKIYPLLGDRTVAGRIVNDSYGVMKQQRTVTVEVLWSTGVMPFPPLRNLRLKGQDFRALKILRQLWLDEAKRAKVFLERHTNDPNQSQVSNHPSEKKQGAEPRDLDATEMSARKTIQAQDIKEDYGELQYLQKTEIKKKSSDLPSGASGEPGTTSVCMARDNRSLQESHSGWPPYQSTCLLRKERTSQSGDKALSMDCSITCDDTSGAGNSAEKHVCAGCSSGRVLRDGEGNGIGLTGMHKHTSFPQDAKDTLPLKNPVNVHLQVPSKQPVWSGPHGVKREETFEVVDLTELYVTPISDNVQDHIVDNLEGPLQKKHVTSDFQPADNVSILGSREVIHQLSSCNTSLESYCCNHAPRIEMLEGGTGSQNYQSITKARIGSNAGQESLSALGHRTIGATISCNQPGNQAARQRFFNPERVTHMNLPEAGKVMNNTEGQILQCRKRECNVDYASLCEKWMARRKDEMVNGEGICEMKPMHVKESTPNGEILGIACSKQSKEEKKFKQPKWVRLLKHHGDEADQLMQNYLEHAKASEDLDKAGMLEALIYAKKKIKRLSERCKSHESPSFIKEEHCLQGTSLSWQKLDIKAKTRSNSKVDAVMCEDRGERQFKTSVKYKDKKKDAKSSNQPVSQALIKQTKKKMNNSGEFTSSLTGVRKQRDERWKMKPTTLDVNDDQCTESVSSVLADDYRTQVQFCTEGETEKPGEEFMSTTHATLGKGKKKQMHSKASSMSILDNTGQQKEQKHCSGTAKSSKKAAGKGKHIGTRDSEKENGLGGQVIGSRKREKTMKKRKFSEPDVPILVHKKKKKLNHSSASECDPAALKSKRKYDQEIAELAAERVSGNKNESQPQAEKQITVTNDICVHITSGEGSKKMLPTQLYCQCRNLRPKACANNCCRICCEKTHKACKKHKKTFL